MSSGPSLPAAPRPCLALLAVMLAGSACAAEPVIDVYVSTGDNHFLGSSLPIDSPRSIAATFDLFRHVNHARRVYWRGLEASCWLATMQARPENSRYHSFWQWLVELYATTDPDTLAVQAAHARGMEIWGVGTLWDWGADADTPGFGDYPFAFESRLRLEHPEWVPVNRHGTRRQGGPIELAYPEARRALVRLIVAETLEAGYDGITFLTYVENFSMRYQDEFGYSDPVVADFRQRHKVDIRTEPFRRGGSREDWLRLRGSYVTAFLRELKAELDPHGVQLGMIVNSNDPRLPQSWNVPELMLTAGSHHMDVDTWVREGLVDELHIYGNNSGQSQLATLDDLVFLTRGTKTRVSVMTSGPFREAWKPHQDAGRATILAVNEDGQHLERGFIPAQEASALAAADPHVRMRVLAQAADGTRNLPVAPVVAATSAENLIERRLALRALGRMPDAPLEPLLAGLRDPENGVRCAAALALADRRDATACAALLGAAEAHGNHMLRECVVIALRRLSPVPAGALREAAARSPARAVREVAMRTLMVHADATLVPVFAGGLDDADRFVRVAAAEALGNVARNDDAVELLVAALRHADAAVAARAATSLGKLAASATHRDAILAALVARFREAPHDGWSFRPIGNALLECGDAGRAALVEIRDGPEPRLAELAWRVVDLPQRPNAFSEITAEQDSLAHARRPTPRDPEAGRADGEADGRIDVDPLTGDDAADGRTGPVRTIRRAIGLARPGDTIHLAPGRYFETADLSRKHGAEGRPITLDGHGAVIDGSEPIVADEWESLGGDLYRRVALLPRFDEAMRARWFFLWDGRMNRMGLCSKGPSLPLKKPEDLQADEWTYVPEEDAFYIRMPAGKRLDEKKIRYPARGNGVVQSVDGSWHVVRNLVTTHVYNDGFNVHGAQRHLVYENIAAIECGDDGFSAHEDAECDIRGFVSIGNATGLCDTVSSLTRYRDVFIGGCAGYDIFFIGDSPHAMENVLVESAAARPLEVARHGDREQGGLSTATLRNVRITRTAASRGDIRVGRDARLMLDGCTLDGPFHFVVTPGGAVAARGSAFLGKADLLLYTSTIWQGDANHYDLASLRIGQTSFTARTFADFRKAVGDEARSTWSDTAAPADVGAGDLGHLSRAAEAVLQGWRQRTSQP